MRKIPNNDTRPKISVKLSGTFHLRKPIELGPEASGVTFLGPAIISGGLPLREWKDAEFNGRPVWATAVPSETVFRELFAGKASFRAPRTMLPETGFYNLAGYSPPEDAKAPWNQGQTSALFKPGDLHPSWRNLNDVEIVVHHYWVTSRLPLSGLDEAGHVNFSKKSVFKLADDYSGKAAPYVVENVAEALVKPGQWYHDRPSGTLYYLPKRGERRERFVAYAPLIPVLLRVNGAAHTTFKNIEFTHSEYTLPSDSSGDIQAAFNVPGAVQLNDCVGTILSDCRIQHIGSYAIEILGQSHNCQVHHTLMKDLGGGGVKLGPGTTASTIADCTIESGGRLFASAEGVWVSLSGGNHIIHNRIRDFYYTGISVGWDWGFKDTDAKNNVIAFNDISDIGQGELSDMGGIYVLGKQPNSVIFNNRIRNVQARGYGGWGIYLDEGSTGWTVENNVVLNTKTGGFHIHYGGNNSIKNNIFAFAQREGQLIRQRDDQQGPIRFEHNLVISRPGDAPLVVGNWLHRDVTLTGMLYAVPKSSLPFGDDGTGQFIETKVSGDGVLPDDSVAFKLGFKRIDLNQVGPRSK